MSEAHIQMRSQGHRVPMFRDPVLSSANHPWAGFLLEESHTKMPSVSQAYLPNTMLLLCTGRSGIAHWKDRGVLLATSEDGSLARIGLRLSISVGIDGLRDIVHGIETGNPLLFIDDLSVRAVEDREGGTDPHYLGPLDVTLQVSGFRLKDKAS